VNTAHRVADRPFLRERARAHLRGAPFVLSARLTPLLVAALTFGFGAVARGQGPATNEPVPTVAPADQPAADVAAPPPEGIVPEQAGAVFQGLVEPLLFRWARPSVGGQDIALARATLSWQSSGRWLIEGAGGLWRGLETVGWDAEVRAGHSLLLAGRRTQGHWELAAPLTIGGRMFERPATLASDGYGFTESIIGAVAAAALESTRWGRRFGFVARAGVSVTIPIVTSTPKSPYYSDGKSSYVLDAGIALGVAVR
jgi:hypothetical protein